MKIEARLETIGGQLVPVLFFLDEVQPDKTIAAFSESEGHSTASRAYMRQCKPPATESEYLACFQVLRRYCQRFEVFAKINGSR
jgi:hypothetical protein